MLWNVILLVLWFVCYCVLHTTQQLIVSSNWQRVSQLLVQISEALMTQRMVTPGCGESFSLTLDAVRTVVHFTHIFRKEIQRQNSYITVSTPSDCVFCNQRMFFSFESTASYWWNIVIFLITLTFFSLLLSWATCHTLNPRHCSLCAGPSHFFCSTWAWCSGCSGSLAPLLTQFHQKRGSQGTESTAANKT